MALVRVSALKDFRANALSTTVVSTGYNLGAPTTGQKVYAALHLTSASLGTTSRMLVMTLQSASSSGFSPQTQVASFVLSTAAGAEWASPAGSLSTDRIWWRADWTLSTVVSTGGTWKGLTYMGIK